MSSYIAQAKPTVPLIWNVQNANHYYVGRKTIIMEVANLLSKKDAEISIVGSAGIGKTQFAKKYAELHRKAYDIVWWFDVGKNMSEQYAKLAKYWNRINNDSKVHINLYLPQNEVIAQMNDNLRVTKLNWLLIFDNATDRNQIREYIPSNHNRSGHILITSKNPYSWNHVMKLEKFKRNESIELITKIIGENNHEQADKLADILGDYPLAIAQSASYIKSHLGLTIEEYISLFLTSRKRLWDEESKNHKYALLDNYKFTAFTTIALTVKEIQKESLDAFELLVFCSYLNSKTIYESLLRQYATNILKLDHLSFRKTIAILGRYSLISQNNNVNSKLNSEEITYNIHELSQLAVRDLLSKRHQKEYLGKCLSVTANFLSSKSDVFIPYLANNDGFILNMESIAIHAIQAQIYNNDLLVLYHRLIGYNLAGKRDYKVTQELISKVDGFMKRVSDIDLILKARFCLTKSSLLAWQNLDYQGGLKHSLEALKILNKMSPQRDEHLTAYNGLSQLYSSMGENEDALIYAKQGLAMVNKDNNLGNQDALYNSLCRIYNDKGNFKLALEYAEKSIGKITNKGEKILIGDVPTYIMRPIILIKMERYKNAYKHLSKLYKAADKTFGKTDHFYKACIYCYHAYALFKSQNALSKAKDILIKSQNMFVEALGKNNIKNRVFGTSHIFLGEIYEEEKDYAKAQLEYSNALQVFLNSYNGEEKATDSFSYLYTRLAIINVKLKDTTTAQQYLDLHRKAFGHKHHRTIQIINCFIDNKLSVGF
jgi:tetratricopeptide (TPR) repeat protein